MSKFNSIQLGFKRVQLHSVEFDYGSITIQLSFFILMICNFIDCTHFFKET